jgi:SAM-dependent methyltransferase
VKVLLIGGHGYLGSALQQALPTADTPPGDYATLGAVELGSYDWIIFLAYRKREDAATDSERFVSFVSRLPAHCRLLLVSSAAWHGVGEHAEKVRAREQAVAGRTATWVVRPGSVCGPAPHTDRDSLLNRMVLDARDTKCVRIGNVNRPVLTTRDWVRAIVHVLNGSVPEDTYALASFNAWMPSLGAEVAHRFGAALESVAHLGTTLDCRLDTSIFERTGFTFLDGIDAAISEAHRAVGVPPREASIATPLESCVCCGSSPPHTFLDLGERPPANALKDRRDGAEARYPLALAECQSCGHWQLTLSLDPAAIFRADYPYRAGVTATNRSHFADLAAECASRAPGRRALEIGCNDGTLLKALTAHGFSACGVDPAPQSAEFRMFQALWGPQAAADLFPEAAFDLVCACNVLAHVATPVEFMAAVRRVLAPDGIGVVEVTDSDAMVHSGRWDLVYHEHVSYFRETSLALTAVRAGLRVDAIERVPSHGGSLRMWVSNRPSDADRFATAVHRQIHTVRATLSAASRPLVGFGCPAKAALLLEEAGVQFDYLADDTPAKIGKYLPGIGCEIRPLAALAAEPAPVTIVLLAWNYPQEFTAWMQANRAGRGDRVIELGGTA